MFHEEPMKESSNIFPGVFKPSLCGRLTRNIPAKLFDPEPADAKQKRMRIVLPMCILKILMLL